MALYKCVWTGSDGNCPFDIYSIVLLRDFYCATIFSFSWSNINHFRLININSWFRLTLIDSGKVWKKCDVSVWTDTVHVVWVKRSVLLFAECSQYFADVSGWREAALQQRGFWVSLSMLFLRREVTYPKSSFTAKQYGGVGLWCIWLGRAHTGMVLFRVWWCIQMKPSNLP